MIPRDDFVAMLAREVQSFTTTPFDAAAWVSWWLNQPLPALGWQLPANFLDTEDGRATVLKLLRQIQSGTYA